MQYLGEFLSTTNTITETEDTVTKYFYYRPDKYDDPSADLETIFDLRALSGFPQIGDTLSENNNYRLNNIEINKRLDDTEKSVKKVSYVVTCTYRNAGPDYDIYDGTGRDDDVKVDKDGNRVNKDTLPWKMPNEWSSSPQAVETSFIKGYDWSYPERGRSVDVVNRAGKRIIASTTRYRRVFNIKFNLQNISNALALSACYINSSPYTLPVRNGGLGTFDEYKLLIEPPTFNVKYFKQQDSSTLIPYYEYSVKFTYDPEGWDRKFLNIGTFARFSANEPAEQIYSYHTISGAMPGPLNYTNLAGVMRAGGGGAALSGIAWEKVTEPLPLTDQGFIFQAAIEDPENNPYVTVSYHDYQYLNFNTLNIPE